MLIKGILFDKDGTLIDFYEVWGKAAVKVAKRLCDARRMPERQRMLLREMGVADGRVDPDGALAWKSYRGVAEDLQEYLGTDPEKLAGELEGERQQRRSARRLVVEDRFGQREFTVEEIQSARLTDGERESDILEFLKEAPL